MKNTFHIEVGVPISDSLACAQHDCCADGVEYQRDDKQQVYVPWDEIDLYLPLQRKAA